jgi:pilus assembly protein CpaF
MFGKKGSEDGTPKKKAPPKKKEVVADSPVEQPQPAATADKDKEPPKKKKAPAPAEDSQVDAELVADVASDVPIEKENMSEEQAAALMALSAESGGGRDSGSSAEPEKKEKKAPKKSSGDEDPFANVDEQLAGGNGGEQQDSMTSLRLQRARNRIWLDLRDGIDLKALARMESKTAREEVQSAVEEIARFRNLDVTPAELEQIARECANDMLGYGPLEPLLERDDIADIMINGPDITYIEVDGKIEKANIKFRDNQHLTTIAQRIVGAIGRRVDEASPICDARLPDGSRVNAIIQPLAIDGACLTIRKFKKDKLTLDNLVQFGSMTPSCAKLVMAIGRCRVNVLVSGGTGSGKTTMLNCLTRYIDTTERIITCEDAAELQLQQPHVVRLETRPPNLEGVGEITMRDLVKNCLRMRPERIIVGEVRGPEAFDLLQAMNTGHDGSMGTVHANNPREAVSRMENMIAMGGLNLPIEAVREQIAGAVNVIIQVQRLRDGSRKTTHVTEVTGMEGDVVTLQDLFVLDIEGEDDNGKLITRQRSTGLRPKFFDKARQYGVHQLVLDAMDEAYDDE